MIKTSRKVSHLRRHFSVCIRRHPDFHCPRPVTFVDETLQPRVVVPGGLDSVDRGRRGADRNDITDTVDRKRVITTCRRWGTHVKTS